MRSPIALQLLVIVSIKTVLIRSQQPTLAKISNPATTCDFENSDICGWTQDHKIDSFDWSRSNAKTLLTFLWAGLSGISSRGTGPSFDHTFGKDKTGHYMYIEASSPRRENDTARLFSPVYNQDGQMSASDDVMCFHMWYHMYGSATGSMKVYLKVEDSLSQLWSASGYHGDQWLQTIISFQPASNKTFQLVIEATRGSGYSGDSAIDDVSLLSGDSCTTSNNHNMSGSFGDEHTAKIEYSTSPAPQTTTLTSIAIPTTATAIAVSTTTSTPEITLTTLTSNSPNVTGNDLKSSFLAPFQSFSNSVSDFVFPLINSEVNTTNTTSTNSPSSPAITNSTIISTNSTPLPITNSTATTILATTAFPTPLTNALAQRSVGGVGAPVAIGIATAVLVLVALVIAVVFMLYKRHCKRASSSTDDSEAILLNATEASS